jgi:hypothetical protein
LFSGGELSGKILREENEPNKIIIPNKEKSLKVIFGNRDISIN